MVSPKKKKDKMIDPRDDDSYDETIPSPIEDLPDYGSTTEQMQNNSSPVPANGLGDNPVMMFGGDGMANPFVEISKLINDDGIKGKSILTKRQVSLITKLEALHDIYEANGMRYQAMQIRKVCHNFLTFAISTDGISRKQFIEAMQKGSERAEGIYRDRNLQGGGGIRI